MTPTEAPWEMLSITAALIHLDGASAMRMTPESNVCEPDFGPMPLDQAIVKALRDGWQPLTLSYSYDPSPSYEMIKVEFCRQRGAPLTDRWDFAVLHLPPQDLSPLVGWRYCPEGASPWDTKRPFPWAIQEALQQGWEPTGAGWIYNQKKRGHAVSLFTFRRRHAGAQEE